MPNQGAWTPSARRLGIGSATAVLTIGVVYLAVIVTWWVVEQVPQEPIGDPYFAVMEGLTLASAASLIGLLSAIYSLTPTGRRIFAVTASATGILGAGLTMAVHFTQLTAVRQLWRAGDIPDYRLVWPSAIFAVEYLAWDVLIGLTMVLMACSLEPGLGARRTRHTLLVGGCLCLVGTAGPATGWMQLQNLSVVGYGVFLPIAGGLLVRLFAKTPASIGSAV